jgi:hypothetical protein
VLVLGFGNLAIHIELPEAVLQYVVGFQRQLVF